jgi:hypothetical protein
MLYAIDRAITLPVDRLTDKEEQVMVMEESGLRVRIRGREGFRRLEHSEYRDIKRRDAVEREDIVQRT